jgi:hypothetical protein
MLINRVTESDTNNEKTIVAGMKKFEYKGKQWHEQCFCCKVCRQPIGTKSFIPRDQEVVCVPCYEENYAQRCMKCNGVMSRLKCFNKIKNGTLNMMQMNYLL